MFPSKLNNTSELLLFNRFRPMDHFRQFGHPHLPPPHHPLFSNAAFKTLCSCCPPTSPSSLKTPFHPFPLPLLSPTSISAAAAVACSTPNSIGSLIDPRTSSVAELRRKAHEHSAALLQSFHQSLFTGAAAAAAHAHAAAATSNSTGSIGGGDLGIGANGGGGISVSVSAANAVAAMNNNNNNLTNNPFLFSLKKSE